MPRPIATVVKAGAGFQLQLDGSPACEIIPNDSGYEFIKPRNLYSVIAFQLDGTKVPDALSLLVTLTNACRNYGCNFKPDVAAEVFKN